MKRIILVILTLALALQLFSCKKEASQNDTEIKETEAATLAPSQQISPNLTIADIESYENPIIKVGDKNTWENYGVGDPFVMRFNGRYYLYCSTKDGEIGIRCFISDDLVNWKYSGLCASEPLTMSAYAPEVVYYNGYFYMYTSPAGNGHYILKSESPTGPFLAVTDNLGLSIDGNVFIDDDGSWYFYSASYDGIMVYPMSAPDKIESSLGKLIPLDMNGWTEGSMIVKHNGTYYMTYTGNHVWSSGYRINYAVSTSSPLEFQSASNNPLLLSTDSNTVMGIGHSSTVLGPNLDEYYIVYHSYKTVPKRNMNIDRIVFNGDGTVVLGPTTDAQQAPAMPDVYSYFEATSDLSAWNIINGEYNNSAFVLLAGGQALSKISLGDNYTAEYNLSSISEKAGFLFSYQDEQNFGRATYNSATSELTIEFIINGSVTKNTFAISASFAETLKNDALTLFTVRKSENEYTFFVNNREVFSAQSQLSGGSVGAFCESGRLSLGFIGATNGSLQSTLKDVYKPTESAIPAFTSDSENTEIKLYDGVQYLSLISNKSYSYKTNTAKSGAYDLMIEYRSKSLCVLEIYQNDVKLGEISLQSTSGKLTSVANRSFELNADLSNITFYVKQGNADLLNFYFHKSESVTEKSYDFKNSLSSSYKDGYWKLEDGKLVLKSDFGKFMVGSENWGNYVVEADIAITSDTINAGLCVRVSNPSTRDDSPSGGSDYLQGYFIGFGEGSVFLGKQNYNWNELKRVEFDVQKGQTYHIKAEVTENTLRISIDGKHVITYKDTDHPFLHGMVGFRAHSSSMAVDNLTIRPID